MIKLFKSKLRKGFTLVELIVVIAIVAILAAVSVVSYVAFINSANKSADEQTVTQVNNALQADEILNGKALTPTDAIKVASEAGFLVENLTPTKKGYIYAWNRTTNRFNILENEKVVYPSNAASTDKINLYKFVSTIEDNNSYSLYLKSNFDGILPTSINYGIDFGENKTTTLNYTNASETAQDVIIRTNGGELNINAPLDSVKHYGIGTNLNVTAVALESYHENGTFSKATIAKGRIVIETIGNIPSVEVTSASNSIKIETDKDIVVSASPEVVAELGENKLSNVDVNVTSEDAEVVVDDKVDTTKVTVNGNVATESEIQKITKVNSLEKLLTALTNKNNYIMFDNNIVTNGTDLINITYSMTLDGNGFTLSGDGGLRGTTKQMICIGYNAPQEIEKIVIKNMIVKSSTVTRPLECRGNTTELIFDNVKLDSFGPSNDQGFTYGGNKDTIMKLTINNCDFKVGNDGYVFIFFNPVDMKITNSVLTGWAALYFKSPSSSHGSRDSKIYIENSDLICRNYQSGDSNDFGAIVFEDGNIDATLNNVSIDVVENGEATQRAVLFNSEWANYYGTELKNGHVVIKGTSLINGKIISDDPIYDITNDVKIEGGTYTIDPSEFVVSPHYVEKKGAFFIVK